MVKASIARLLGRREQLHPEVMAVLAQLDQLAETHPPLQDAALLQAVIVREIYRAPPQVGTLELPQERAAEKLRSGEPLLSSERVPLDMPALRALILQLCRALQDQAGISHVAPIAEAIQRHAIDVEPLVQAMLDGQATAIHERAAELDLDADMLRTLLRFSLFPAFERLAAQLAPLRADIAWPHGYCPTCGSWPLLGEYRGLEQTRLLRCGLCASAWAVDRLLCPFCGSRDHADLSYLQVEGEEQKRVVTCEQCRSYIKMLATLLPLAPLELIVQDLATLHLDAVALERGYAPPA